MTPTSVALIGLKESGKTTFLAALWHLVEARELPSALRARALQPDREYLNQIRGKWLAFESVTRTQLIAEKRVDLLLERPNEGRLIDLSFPDVSGESYRIQWSLRKARAEYETLAPNVQGLLLFVHPLHIKIAERIPSIGHSGPTVTATKKEWLADSAPTQVQLVDVLQTLQYLRHSASVLRVSVVVSAWDLLSRTDNYTPTEWLEAHLPLVYQYLGSRERIMQAQVYGVSAQGGAYDKDRKALAQKKLASSRVMIVDGEGRDLEHDITRPLEFVLAGDKTTM